MSIFFSSCETCHLSYFACPGHFGHVELPVTIFHPLFMTTAYKLLYATCLYCHNFKMPEMLVSAMQGSVQIHRLT
jgi:DNA-directed RNA polymerase I subunit RPA1